MAVFYKLCGWTLVTCLSVTAVLVSIFCFISYPKWEAEKERFEENTETSPNLRNVAADLRFNFKILDCFYVKGESFITDGFLLQIEFYFGCYFLIELDS